MKQTRMQSAAICLLSLAFAATPALSQSTTSVRAEAPVALWPKGAPTWAGSLNVPVKEELRHGGDRLWNVSQPTLQAYLPKKGNGAAVIVAPGGGFRFLSIRSEGTMVAQWLAEHGVAAFVLKYRVVQIAPGETEEAMHKRMNSQIGIEQAGDAALTDGRLALRYVRDHAGQWGVDPHKVGVVGFSAGGHVAGMLAHEAKKEDRADFVGLIYGLPFTKVTPPIPSANLPFPPGTPSEPWLQPKPTPAPDALPPIFIAMAQDDLAVGLGVRDYYAKLFAAGYRPETHLYARGSHGFGMKGTGTTVDHWIEEFDWWLDQVLADMDGKRTK